MQRILFSPISRDRFFKKVYQNVKTWDVAARICGVSGRTIRDWAHGIHAPQEQAIKKLSDTLNIKQRFIVINDTLAKRQFARKGALARIKKYGNPGTQEGRRKGGLHALQTLRKRHGHKFILQKKINKPKYSGQLAEFIGILLGDGGITKWQVTITLHKKDDREFITYVHALIKKLFNVTASICEYEMVKNIVVSRSMLVRYLQKMGLSIGNKVHHQIAVPAWIKKKSNFTKMCLRGLFDTDGCFYVDKHRYKKKQYINCGMNFTNRSIPLLSFFKIGLERLGLHPTQKTSYSVFLRREKEIMDYFQRIGSSNLKHINKFKKYFLNRYGEVPKWS